MFCAEYGARPKLVWERCPWNVRRSSKPFLDGWPPFGRVCCISIEHLVYSQSVCMVSLGWSSWTSLELGDYHAPSSIMDKILIRKSLSLQNLSSKQILIHLTNLLLDPRLREKVSSFHPNDREKIKGAYLQRCSC